MLEFIRTKQKSVLIQVVFWAIIATFIGTIFLVWGKGDEGGSGQSENYAVKVNGAQVSLDQYRRAYDNLYRIYQNLYAQAWTPELEKQLNLHQQALDALIDQVLLAQEAERLNLDVSKQEVIDAIAAMPVFQENGAFNRDRYLQILRSQRLTPDEFESAQKQEVLVDKARQRLQKGATADEAEIVAEYKAKNEKVDLLVARIDPALFVPRVQIDPAGLQSFFATRKESFRLPETASIRYFIVDAKPFAAGVKLSDADLEKYYQRNLDDFEIPEQVRASHILIQVPRGADAKVKGEKRALAEALRDRAKKGEDFAALARSASEDPGSRAQGGDLGLFGRGTMVPAFEEAVFALSTGAVSDVVETDYGFHVIKLTERHEAQIKPLASVIETVRKGATEARAAELAMEKAMDLYNLNRKDGSLDAAAKAWGGQVHNSNFFTRDEPELDGKPLPKDLGTSVFGLKAGELGRPVALPQGALVYALKEKREPHVPELDEVKVRAEAAYRQEKARELARSEGNRLLADVRGGADLKTAAASRGIPSGETGLFARSGSNFVPMIGSSEALSNAAFALTPAQPVANAPIEVEGALIVFALKEKQNADPVRLVGSVREEMQKAVLERKEQEILKKELKALRDKSQIVYSAAVEADLKK